MYNIAYSLSNNTYLAAIVSIQSILLNLNNASIKFYLMIDDLFEKKYVHVFEKFFKQYQNIHYDFIKIDSHKYLSEGVNFTNRFYIFEIGNVVK